jgi:peptidoglycan/LPS O-acetylase OafA/YrhL
LYFFYLQNLTTTSPAFFRISWSLAVEQFCYIIGPLALFFLIRIFPKKDKKFLFLTMSVIIILIFILVRVRFSMTHNVTSIFQWNESLRKVTLYRLDAIYYGFVAFYFINKHSGSPFFDRLLFIIGSTGVLFLNFFIFNLGITVEDNQMFFNVFYLPLNSISICFLLPYLITVKIQSPAFLKFVTLVSVLSYSIYLLHYTIILHGLKTFFPSDSLSGILLFAYTISYWLLVLFLSYLQYRFFEKPMTDLRDKN